jgi:chemotaxis protein CheD
MVNRPADPIDIFLQPGDLFVGDADFRIRTILGSCVSITLWHPASRTGGMSHFLLPTRGMAAAATDLDGRYGDEALRVMLAQLHEMGVPNAQLQGKIFGGGNMFPGRIHASAIHVGQRNGEAGRALLTAHGIRIVSESLFGEGHRQILFDVASGDVWARQVKPRNQEADAEAQAEDR